MLDSGTFFLGLNSRDSFAISFSNLYKKIFSLRSKVRVIRVEQLLIISYLHTDKILNAFKNIIWQSFNLYYVCNFYCKKHYLHI